MWNCPDTIKKQDELWKEIKSLYEMLIANAFGLSDKERIEIEGRIRTLETEWKGTLFYEN